MTICKRVKDPVVERQSETRVNPQGGFGWFGEVPQELLFDQMRAVVLWDDHTGGDELGVERGLLAVRRVLRVPTPGY